VRAALLQKKEDLGTSIVTPLKVHRKGRRGRERRKGNEEGTKLGGKTDRGRGGKEIVSVGVARRGKRKWPQGERALNGQESANAETGLYKAGTNQKRKSEKEKPVKLTGTRTGQLQEHLKYISLM